MKKALIILFLLFLSTFSFAAITDYTVPSKIPLNKNLTIYGTYSGGPDILCSFFLFDIKDQNQVIIRLSDQYTNSLGEFYSEYQLTEPLFRRGIDYNAITVCGSDKIGKIFYVEQKEDIVAGITSDTIKNDFAFWLKPENSMTAFFLFFATLCVLAIFAGPWLR